MDSSFGKEGILSRLRLLDEDLDFRFGGARRFELVISGGSALSIRGLIPSRVTTDIDVLSCPTKSSISMSAYDMTLMWTLSGICIRLTGTTGYVPWNLMVRYLTYIPWETRISP